MSDMTIKRPVERLRVDHLVDQFLRLNMQHGIPFAQQTQCIGTIASYLSSAEYQAVAEKMLETLAGSASIAVQQTVLAIRNSAQDVVRSALKKIMEGQADLSAEKTQLERLKDFEVHAIEGFHDIVRTCYSTKTLAKIIDFLLPRQKDAAGCAAEKVLVEAFYQEENERTRTLFMRQWVVENNLSDNFQALTLVDPQIQQTRDVDPERPLDADLRNNTPSPIAEL